MPTGILADLDRNTVSHWVHVYKEGGFEALFQYNYGTNTGELEKHYTPVKMITLNDRGRMLS